jgi:C1A family cysteine protease
MAGRHKSDALLRLTLLLVLFISFANLPVTVHAGSPDLTIDSIWLEDASQIGQPLSQLSAGQSFNIIATIKNIGQDAASGYYLDVFYDGDYGRGGPDSIALGEVQTWYVGPFTAQAGSHTTNWAVDPDNQIAELDETNNQKELVFTVGSETVTTTVTSNSTSSTTESTSTTITTMTSSSTSSTTQLTSTSTSSLLVTHALGWLPEDIPEDARVTPIVSAALPTHFDWTQKDSQNWITSVKNQGGCGSCVAFSAVGALEGQLKIQANNPSWNIDLSEQHLFSCGGGTCSGGWYISSALNYLQQYGTPDEACSPYRGQSGSGSCSNSCPDWQSRASKISSWSWVANNPSAVEAALMNGPLVAGFTVYADFYGYNGGVYHWDHVSQAVGGHAIVIVGYDSNEQYWIVKNSWSANWGENGYFKIGFGEAGIEQYVASVRTAVSNRPPVITAITGLSSNVLSPQMAGGAITWTASASDPDGDAVQYQFWLYDSVGGWRVVQAWSTASTWSWTPSSAGTYYVEVWVRDGLHSGSWDAYWHSDQYVIQVSSNQPPSIAGFSADKLSPQQVGTVVMWTASASDPDGDAVQYQFWLYDSVGGWRVVQAWSTASTWSWTPSSAGTYYVEVWVRDGLHSGSWDAYWHSDQYVIQVSS